MEDKEIIVLDSEKISDYLDGSSGKGTKRKRQRPSNSENDLAKKSSPPEKRARTVFEDLLKLEEEGLVSNFERFKCPVCLDEFDVGEGVTLKECLHSACRECLAGAVAHCEEPLVQCPYADEDYTCTARLQQCEVRALVSPEMFEKYLGRSVSLAECQAQDSFHCRTPDCPGWWLREGEGNAYVCCPVCGQENCMVCSALHGGLSCEQWKMEASASSAEAKKNRAYLEKALKKKTAMLCPTCQAVLTKAEGCDWMECSACKTEICWATRGPRWGPGGRGDTSGGCGCTKEKKCHRKCQYCH